MYLSQPHLLLFFSVVVAPSIALEAVALVIVLVKRGTQLRFSLGLSLSVSLPLSRSPPLSLALPLTLLRCLGASVTESAHKATEMKILTSKCTAAAREAAAAAEAAPVAERVAPQQGRNYSQLNGNCARLIYSIYISVPATDIVYISLTRAIVSWPPSPFLPLLLPPALPRSCSAFSSLTMFVLVLFAALNARWRVGLLHLLQCCSEGCLKNFENMKRNFRLNSSQFIKCELHSKVAFMQFQLELNYKRNIRWQFQVISLPT